MTSCCLFSLAYHHSDMFTRLSPLYLVLVGHVASGPHLLHHQVPQISLGFQIGLKRLLSAANAQLQAGNSQEQEGGRGHLHLLQTRQTNRIKISQKAHPQCFSLEALWSHLYIPVLCHLHVTRSPVCQQEEPSLSHGDLAHAAACLDRGGQLEDALAGLNVLQDRCW